MPAELPMNPTLLVRKRIVGRVRSVFNDTGDGEEPVQRSSDALFAPNSVIWRVHGDVTAMMAGGMSALLLQMLHPAALAGVIDHSSFRTDMLGRLRRTARFIATTTYGDRADAEKAIDRVRAIHDRVSGTLADGTMYRASDPHLLAWVHVAEAVSFLGAWIAFAEPRMSGADQDRYFAEFALIARMLGADPVPETRHDAIALVERMRPQLHASPQCRDVARLILSQRMPGMAAATAQGLVARSAIDLLPGWARDELRLKGSGPGEMLVRSATFGMAATLRWAFAAV